MSGDHLNLDAIEAQTRHRAQWGDDAHCGTVLALVAEVRRLRDDREMGRTNLAHYSEIIDAQAGEIEALLARVESREAGA